MLWPIILAGIIGVLLAQAVIVHDSLAHNANGGDAGATQFIAGSRAVTAFAENNPGYTGSITAQQLAPYMAPYALPMGFAAQIANAQLTMWVAPGAGSASLPANLPADVWNLTGNDCAYAVNPNGTLQSPCGSLGAAPAGVPTGSLVYTISAPL
ncbi:MAG: type IV pilus biogenesis protein PilM [Acidithiobacillus sp.]